MPRLIIASILIAFIPGGSAFAQTANAARFQVIGYYAEHNAYGNFSIKQIDTSGAAALLTQLDYAFARVAHNRCEVPEREVELNHPYSAADSVDGSADTNTPNQLRGSFHQLQELKRKHPRLKILISFGGWGNSEGFSDAAEPQNLKAFVRSCVDTFIKGNFAPGIHAPGIFDGIDVDWEYPVDGGMIPGRPEDKQNMTLLAAEFRRQLDAVHPGLLLTAAIPAGAEDYTHYDLKAISRYFDYLSLMVYDLHWNVEKTTNLHSALFHDPADKSRPPLDTHYGAHAVMDFLKAGVPARKIVFGVPFYGKGWTGVADKNHGLYQPASGPSKQPSSYRDLKALPATADAQFNQTAATCTIWNQGEFWSYDCPRAMRAKLRFIHQHHLGGVMFWELGDDTPDAELLKALVGKDGSRQ
jgi:chitinase